METSAKTAANVEDAFLETSQSIYDNITNGLYDLTNEKSGIRVGNESGLGMDPKPTKKSKQLGSKSQKQTDSQGGCC